jgi:hypothetical protein
VEVVQDMTPAVSVTVELSPSTIPNVVVVAFGYPVAFCRLAEAGVPSAGLTKLGPFVLTKTPDPVVPNSPKTPELLNSTKPFVPPLIVVVPTVSPVMPEQSDPDARQIAPDPDTAVPRAVATPVPKPEIPVLTGKPVPLPRVIVGAVPKTNDPEPVPSVTVAARLVLVGVPKNVPMPVARPEIPESGVDVAAIVPEPAAARLAPVPTTIAAPVFVPPVNAEKAAPTVPPPIVLHVFVDEQ